MRLIVIYGPPAAGKLTIANELAKMTGFAVLHNHLTEDPFKAVLSLPMDHPLFRKFVNLFRVQLIELAAKSHTSGLIYTMVYVKEPREDKYVHRFIRAVRKHKGTVNFVQLQCSDSELFKRARQPSRSRFTKFRNVRALKQFIKEKELRANIPFVKSYAVDNTHLSAKTSAKRIMKQFNIPQKQKRSQN